MKRELLRVEFLCKKIHQTILDNVSFNVFRGEIFVVLGASGAGKTSLIQIIAGITPKDSGRIVYQSQPVCFNSAKEAQSRGIYIVHHFGRIVDALSIAENIFLAEQKYFWFQNKRLSLDALSLIEMVGLEHSPSTLTEKLSISEKSLVELAAVINANPRLLIIDAPPFAHSRHIRKKVHTVIGDLKKKGTSVVYVTDSIKDALEMGDRIMVMRDGIVAGIYERGSQNFCHSRLLKAMAGGTRPIPAGEHEITGPTIFRVSHLSCRTVSDVSFSVRQGETVGIVSPMDGNNKILFQSIFGCLKKSGGQILIDEKAVEVDSAVDAVEHGIGYFSSDRQSCTLIPELTVLYNMTLTGAGRINRHGIIRPDFEKKHAEKCFQLLGLPVSHLDLRAEKLSRGMQLKIQLAQCLALAPRIMLLYEPTAGVDLASKTEICHMIQTLSEQGITIVIASSNIEEIMNICDRFVIMYEGRVKGELSRTEAMQANIIALMQEQ